MSNSDYIARGSGSFATVAVLAEPLTVLGTTATLTQLKSDGADARAVGMAAMINGEIVRVDEISANTITIARGCADTVPKAHAANSVIWFFGLNIGTDGTEYFGTQAVAVKVIPRTPSKILDVAKSPPRDLQFATRFIRPYPPALVKVNGYEIYNNPSVLLSVGSPSMTFTWASRNRVVQADQLIGYTEESIPPEAGTTYRVHILNSAGTRVHTVDDVSSPWVYAIAEAVADLGIPTADTFQFTALLHSVRDGHESLHPHRIPFTVNATGFSFTYGWSRSWGYGFGA